MRPYSNERSEASVKKDEGEWGETLDQWEFPVAGRTGNFE